MEADELLKVYQQLLDHYGAQHWWPAETPFEVMVGAILTQNTSWSGVEKAIANLRSAQSLSPEAILALPHAELGELIRPSGYFNLKSRRLQNFCDWYQQHRDQVGGMNTEKLRTSLLGINGVGLETADDILLYAFERPVFVVDTYTRRLFERVGWLSGGERYEEIRTMVEDCVKGRDAADRIRLFNELHGLIVIHAKHHCKKRPECEDCPLHTSCRYP